MGRSTARRQRVGFLLTSLLGCRPAPGTSSTARATGANGHTAITTAAGVKSQSSSGAPIPSATFDGQHRGQAVIEEAQVGAERLDVVEQLSELQALLHSPGKLRPAVRAVAFVRDLSE